MISIMKCVTCKHFLLEKSNRDKNVCLAFPDGIPLKYRIETESHDKVVKGQTGEYVYEKKAGY